MVGKEGLRAWLRQPANAKRLLINSGVLAEDLLRFSRWWRAGADDEVDLSNPATWFDVTDVQERVPLTVRAGWPEDPAAVEVTADAVLHVRWRKELRTPTGWVEAMRQAVSGTGRVFIRVDPGPDLAGSLSTIRRLVNEGFCPWVVLTDSPLWSLHLPALERKGAAFYHTTPVGVAEGGVS